MMTALAYIENINRILQPNEPSAPLVLDLFAGCGGLALGFEAQGSIDVPVIRDQVASILEGGRDAFIQRKEKYEF